MMACASARIFGTDGSTCRAMKWGLRDAIPLVPWGRLLPQCRRPMPRRNDSKCYKDITDIKQSSIFSAFRCIWDFPSFSNELLQLLCPQLVAVAGLIVAFQQIVKWGCTAKFSRIQGGRKNFRTHPSFQKVERKLYGRNFIQFPLSKC